MAYGRRYKGMSMIEGKPSLAGDLSQSPQFKEAVRAAVAEYAAELQVQAAAHGGAPSASSVAMAAATGGERNFAELLALAIAELNDQGSGRKRVAPEILAMRSKARERMGRLIMEARAAKAGPEYRVMTTMFLNERQIDPYQKDAANLPVPTEIVWSGVPNDGMLPLNKVASEIFDAYKESVGATPRVVQEQPAWITAGGLVVRGAAPARRMVANLENPLPGVYEEGPAPRDPDFADALAIKGPNDPRAKEVRILGSIAEPAKQNLVDA